MALIGISGKIGSGKDLTGDIIKYLDSKSTKSFKDWSTEHIHNGYDISGKSMYGIGYGKDNKWQIKKFADKLKDIVCLLLSCTREQLEDRNFKEKELGEEWWLWEIEGYNSERYIYKTKQEALESQGGYYQPKLVKLTPRKLLQLLGTDCGREIIHPNIWVNSLMSEYKPTTDISKSNTYNDNRLQHGYKNTKIWRTYHNIKQRCNNPNHPRYKDYGGRGITLCKEWEDSILSFIFWAKKEGYNDSLTIDRINNDGGYSPENCRCVSYSTQAVNTKLRRDNTTGYKGVSYDKKNGNRIRANIQINKKIKFLGYFETLEEASEAYELAFLEREKLYEKQENQYLIYPNFVVTDMRFPNEMQAVKDKGGITIRINRPRVVLGGGDNLYEHESETALDNAEFDYVVDNNGTIEDLIEKIKEIMIKENLI